MRSFCVVFLLFVPLFLCSRFPVLWLCSSVARSESGAGQFRCCFRLVLFIIQIWRAGVKQKSGLTGRKAFGSRTIRGDWSEPSPDDEHQDEQENEDEHEDDPAHFPLNPAAKNDMLGMMHKKPDQVAGGSASDSSLITHHSSLPPVALIVPAAGVGMRFNGGNGGPRKQYLPLAGRPILLRTLDRFLGISGIVQRVLVVHPDDYGWTREQWGAELAAAGVTDIVPGGAARQESVRRGLAVLRNDVAIVAVHDSVRPFVSRRAIEQSISIAAEFGGAVVASRMVATVKRADDRGRIVQTVAREDLWMAQTPQTFRKDLLVQAHAAAERDGVAATDDSFLLERLGMPVIIVEESTSNLKITTPEDLQLAEAIWKKMMNDE